VGEDKTMQGRMHLTENLPKQLRRDVQIFF